MMNMLGRALLWIACSATAASAQTLVLRGGRYLDPAAGVYRDNVVMVIRDGRIAELPARSEDFGGARVLELGGRTILPGLIDAHVHLTLSGDARRNAEATLRAGFTTVLDLGSASGASIALREQVASGQTADRGSSRRARGSGIKGGVCEFGGATVSTAEEATARARSDLVAGADVLKVCVTGWPREAVAAPDSVQLKAPLLGAVLGVARESAKPVFAHAIGQAGAPARREVPASGRWPIRPSSTPRQRRSWPRRESRSSPRWPRSPRVRKRTSCSARSGCCAEPACRSSREPTPAFCPTARMRESSRRSWTRGSRRSRRSVRRP
jgi:hypothetical protein